MKKKTEKSLNIKRVHVINEALNLKSLFVVHRRHHKKVINLKKNYFKKNLNFYFLFDK